MTQNYNDFYLSKTTFVFNDSSFFVFVYPGRRGGTSKSLNEGYGPASVTGFYIIAKFIMFMFSFEIWVVTQHGFVLMSVSTIKRPEFLEM